MESDLAQAGHPHGIDCLKLLGIQAVLMRRLVLCSASPARRAPPPRLAARSGSSLPASGSPAAHKRQEDIKTAVSDTLDQLTICVEAGLGFDAALVRVAVTNEGPWVPSWNTRSATCAPVCLGSGSTGAREPVRDPRDQDADAGAHPGSAARQPLAETLRVNRPRRLGTSASRRSRRRRPSWHEAHLPQALCFFPVIFVALLGPSVAALGSILGG